ncbi:MAG: hypothetical protein ACOX87_09020 [Chloroflexota bacterium]|jgi:hypothetical protein
MVNGVRDQHSDRVAQVVLGRLEPDAPVRSDPSWDRIRAVERLLDAK